MKQNEIIPKSQILMQILEGVEKKHKNVRFKDVSPEEFVELVNIGFALELLIPIETIDHQGRTIRSFDPERLTPLGHEILQALRKIHNPDPS